MKLIPLEEFDQYVPPGEAVEPKKLELESIGDLEIDLSDSWTIDRLLPKDGLCIIYGSPSAGKTFAALAMTAHIASGREFAGCEVERGGIVYLSGESSKGFRRRLKAIKDEFGFDNRTPFLFRTVPPNLGKADGDAADLIAAIYDKTNAAGWRADIIVIDTVARAAAGIDENSSRDMGQFIANCDKISSELGALVIGIHHSGKVENAGMRGSSALLGAADCVIAISSDETGARTARIEKQKDGEDGLSFTFKLQKITLGQDRKGRDVTTCLLSDVTDLTRAERKTRTGPSVPASLTLWLSVLDEVLADVGKMSRPFPDGPEVRTVDREAVRAAYYQRRGDDTPEAKKKAFNRGLNSVLDQKIVIATDGDKGVLLWRP
jgi:archaellum biogenesis ATPase FlaH